MLKVMIVDDDINVRKCLRKLIPWPETGCGIVAEASDGVEGLKFFHETKPNIVITDLKMPEMGGEDFCEKLRSVSDSVSIIFLSAYEDFTAAQKSLRYGVTEYILKPINAQKLSLLTAILKRLSSSVSSLSFMNRLLADSAFREEFTSQLRDRNAAFFEDFFADFSVSPGNDFTLIQRNASLLLGLLMDAQEEDSPSGGQKQRLEALEELSALSHRTDIVDYITESYRSFLTGRPKAAQDADNGLTEQIKRYVRNNLGDPQLSLSAIAGHLGFSDDYLGRVFKRDTGVSITAYITHIRLNHACRLLKNTRLSVAEIAQCSGYSSTNYFCRNFKKQLGITPTDYQQHTGSCCPVPLAEQ